MHVHELQQAPLSKVCIFRGTGEYTPSAVASQLGFRSLARQQGLHQDSMLASKFLVSLEQAEYQINAALDSLQVDAHQPVSDHRKARCTGTALQVAVGLLDTGVSGPRSSRIMLFVGGPCTEGAALIHLS